MLQRMTSWFRNNFTNLLRLNDLSGFVVLRQKAGNFLKSHPRLGGGIIFLTVFLIILTSCFIWNLTPVKPWENSMQIVEIRLGAAPREVGRMLEARGLIRNRLAFEIYIRLNPKGRMIKAGWYRISTGMPVPRIVQEFGRGIPQEIRLTIPEGLTIREVADLLAKRGVINKKRFLARVSDLNFVNSILGEFQVNSSPEGYLFPDTYNFMLPATEEEIITTMLERFKQVYQENFSKIPASQRRQIVIIASLVEKEALKAEERPIIAGIFYKRIRLGFRLGSCATVLYALGRHKPKLYDKDLEVDSPYNTYKYYGLPPGPIANPGLASLKAAAFPAKVPYLYFVARQDGTHVFSNTLQEHINAKRDIERNLKYRGINQN